MDAKLIEARDRGLVLAEQIETETRGLVKAGAETKQMQKAIYGLAAELLYLPGEKPRFWHKHYQ